MTAKPSGGPPERAAAQHPPRLDYRSPLPPIASRSLTLRQRIILAAFILFPILLVLVLLAAAMMGS